MRLPFFGRQKQSPTGQAATAISGLLPSDGRGGGLGARTTGEFLRSYSQMPWLRAVVGKVSDSVASIEWRLYMPSRNASKAKLTQAFYQMRSLDLAAQARIVAHLKAQGELREIEQHPLLDLIDGAFTPLTGHSLRKLTQMYIELIGESFWVLERNGARAPVAAWPIPPHWVKELPTLDKPRFLIEHNAVRMEPPEEDVIWMSDPNPVNPYGRGSGTAQALADELETDEFAAKHVKQFFFNRARPDLFVYGEELRQEEMDRIEEAWVGRHQGFWKSFRPFFVNRKLEVKEIGHTFQSMQFIELRRHERDTIVQVYGFPPELFGIVENSNRATIEASDYLYSRWVIQPRLEFWRSYLQERLVPQYDPRLILMYVSPVVEDKDYNLRVAEKAPWSRTVDEWRDLQGLDPLDDDQGKVFIVPNTVRPVSDFTEATPPHPATPPPAAARSKAVTPADVVDAERDLREGFEAVVLRHRAGIDRAAVSTAIALGARGSLDAALDLDGLETLWGEDLPLYITEAVRVGVALAEAQIRERHPEVEFDPEVAGLAPYVDARSAFVVEEMLRTNRAAIDAVWPTLREIEVEDAVDLAISMVGLTESQAEAVLRQYQEQVDMSYAQTQLESRAQRFAAYEAILNANRGEELMWEQAVALRQVRRRDVRRIWQTQVDERVCEICEPMEGEEVGLGAAWQTSAGPVMTPSEVHYLCRCTQVFLEL